MSPEEEATAPQRARWRVLPERAAKQCPRCGFPLGGRAHDGKPCEPPSAGHLSALVKRQGTDRRKGSEGAWREMGAHTW